MFINKLLIIKKGASIKKSILLFSVISVLCFLSLLSFAQAPNWAWAKSAGGSGNDYGASTVVDSSGNVYVAGSFGSNTIVFGSTTLTNAGIEDMFLVKYDHNGNVIWAKRAGGSADDGPSSIAIDAYGNIYIAGCFESSTITFGSYTLTNAGVDTTYDMFLVKYDANGNVLWANRAGGTYQDQADAVTVDAFGNVYMTGYFESSTITFGSTTLTNLFWGYQSGDISLTKYDANGNVIWAKSAGGNWADVASTIAVDISGNIEIAGWFFSTTLTFGSYTLTGTNFYAGDLFLAKYDANGNVLWATSAGGTEGAEAYSVAVDVSKNIYLTGHYYDTTLTFGSYTLTNAGLGDIFFVKYDADGNVAWAKSAGGPLKDWGMSVAVDALSNPYMAGIFRSSTITFGTTTLTNSSTGTYDMFLTKYDPNGNVIWAKSAGGTGIDIVNSVYIDASGNPYMTGNYTSLTIPFGSTTLVNADNSGSTYDMFIAKLGNSTGINELRRSSTISIFPNPATDRLTIETSAIPALDQISIINSTGQELISQQVKEPKTTIDISTLPNGVYFVRMTSDKTVEVGKFVKK